LRKRKTSFFTGKRKGPPHIKGVLGGRRQGHPNSSGEQTDPGRKEERNTQLILSSEGNRSRRKGGISGEICREGGDRYTTKGALLDPGGRICSIGRRISTILVSIGGEKEVSSKNNNTARTLMSKRAKDRYPFSTGEEGDAFTRRAEKALFFLYRILQRKSKKKNI